MLPHFSLLMLGNEVTIKVLQGYFGHGDPLLGVVAHGEAGALAGHCHDVPAKGQQSVSASCKDTFCNSRKFSLFFFFFFGNISQPYKSTFKGQVWCNTALWRKQIRQIKVPDTQEVALRFGRRWLQLFKWYPLRYESNWRKNGVIVKAVSLMVVMTQCSGLK